MTIPLTLKTSYPENSVGCMCGGTIEWDSVPALFSSRNIDRISSALGSPFGARGIFDAAGEFLDTIFGSGFMCGGQCPDSFADGVAISNYVGPRVAITQLRTAVGSSWPSSISASLAPTLDEVQAASTTFVSCLCALGYSTILDKVGGYVVSTGWISRRCNNSSTNNGSRLLLWRTRNNDSCRHRHSRILVVTVVPRCMRSRSTRTRHHARIDTMQFAQRSRYVSV